MIRLYVESPFHIHQDLSLNEDQTHYLLKVMRLKEGDEISVFNGVDGEWQGKIYSLTKKSVMVKLTSKTRPQTKPNNLWLLFSPIKPKRQEFLVEKATELGVSCLCPIRFERTSMLKVNVEKMKAHVIEASEQCGRLSVPEIKPLISLIESMGNWPQDRILLFGDESLTSPSMATLDLDPHQPKAFLVGPEGGFTPQEMALLKSKGQGITLNSNILRAETAALVGISYIQMKV